VDGNHVLSKQYDIIIDESGRELNYFMTNDKEQDL